MNLSTKTMPWMVASLLAATSVFGQTQSQNQGGCPRSPTVCRPQPKCGPLQEPPAPTVCAYNAPAEINIGIQGEYDFFASASFLYWQPTVDNLNVALIDNWSTELDAVGGGFKGNFLQMDFDFKPGFKVGLGMNLQNDDWDGYSEYTRVHGHHNTSSNGSSTGPIYGSVFATRGHPFLVGYNQVFETVSAHYHNNLDFVDAEMGRKYYVGKSLLFRSAFGARGAWILQNLSAHYNTSLTEDYVGTTSTVPSSLDVYSRSHSWAVGPRTGLTMDWLLGSGFRFFGSGYGDILYTKYKLQDKTVYTVNATGAVHSFITRDKVGVLRTHLDLEMGLGWGTYLDNNNWHFDLSAGYGFQVFFDQNMFRSFTDEVVVGPNSTSNGNLYVQGLTLTARLDF